MLYAIKTSRGNEMFDYVALKKKKNFDNKMKENTMYGIFLPFKRAI